MVMVGLMMVNHDDGDGGHDDGNSNQGNAAREGFEQVFMKIRDAPKFPILQSRGGGQIILYLCYRMSLLHSVFEKIHKRKHTGRKPYKCGQCSYSCA